jgi:hypothetical protein
MNFAGEGTVPRSAQREATLTAVLHHHIQRKLDVMLLSLRTLLVQSYAREESGRAASLAAQHVFTVWSIRADQRAIRPACTTTPHLPLGKHNIPR